MKKDYNLIELAALSILIPVAISVGVGVINLGIMGINKIRQIKLNNKINKGLKDGSIAIIDGKYYEVETVEEAE